MRIASHITNSKSINYFQTLEDRLNVVHNNFYDYSNSIYNNTKEKIEVICPLHGSFNQIVSDHLKGIGCPECGKLKALNARKITLEDFIVRATSTYEGLYSYSNVVMGNDNQHKVNVTCEIHGDFPVSVGNHLAGNSGGCPKCKQQHLQDTPKIWSYTKWEDSGKVSSQFDGFKLYIVECWNNNERFIKIGKTYTTVAKRLGFNLPYEYKLLGEVLGSAKYISELESTLHAKHKNLKQLPLLEFGGRHECFNTNIAEAIKEYIKDKHVFNS